MRIDTAAVIIRSGNVLITQRKNTYRARLENKWEFPGGIIEEDETPEEGLKRKIKEKMDIDITISDYIDENIYVFEFIPFRLLVYRTFWDDGNIDLKVEGAYNWVTQDEIVSFDFVRAYLPFVDKIRNGEIEL